MKDYIDLTQLPPQFIDEMVGELNRNDFRGLKQFCDHLGILYGYPLEEVVNVFSNDLMLDKRSLHCAFENFSHKHAVELFKYLIDLFSSENTPLSVTNQLSLDLSALSGTVERLSGEIISEFQNDILLSCEALSNYVSSYVSSQISGIYKTLDELDISDLSDAVMSISFNGKLLENEDGIVNIEAATEDYVHGAINEAVENIDNSISSQEVIIKTLSGDYATKAALNAGIAAVQSMCQANLAEMIRRDLSTVAYIDQKLSDYTNLSTAISSVISTAVDTVTQMMFAVKSDISSTLKLSVDNIIGMIQPTE